MYDRSIAAGQFKEALVVCSGPFNEVPGSAIVYCNCRLALNLCCVSEFGVLWHAGPRT